MESDPWRFARISCGTAKRVRESVVFAKLLPFVQQRREAGSEGCQGDQEKWPLFLAGKRPSFGENEPGERDPVTRYLMQSSTNERRGVIARR